MLTKQGKAFVYKLNPELDACFDSALTHHLLPVQLPDNRYGSYQLNDFYVDGQGAFYLGADNGLYRTTDTGAPLGFSLSPWRFTNVFIGSSISRIGQVLEQAQPSTCLFSTMGSVYCLGTDGQWFNPAAASQLGAYNFYRYDLAADSNSTNTLEITLDASEKVIKKSPYVKITYTGNTGKLVKTVQETLSAQTPLTLNLMNIFRGFNSPNIADPYWYKQRVGRVDLAFYDGSTQTQFGEMSYNLILDQSSAYHLNQLGVIHLQSVDSGIRHGWQLNTHLAWGSNGQDVENLALHAPVADAGNVAPLGRDVNLSIALDGEASVHMPALYDNGRQQLPVYITVCPRNQGDAPITRQQMLLVKQYLLLGNKIM